MDVFQHVGTSFQHAAESLKSDKNFVLEVVKTNGYAVIKYASQNLQADKDIWIAAVTKNGNSWKYASDHLKSDKDVLFTAFKDQGLTLNENMTAKQLMIAKVTQDGNALEYASDDLRKNKEVVQAAVTHTGAALKFAKGGLNQDADMLKAAGLWETEEEYAKDDPFQAILSVKFSLAEKSTPYATQFALAMKNHDYLRNFKTYNPNAWCKKSCDPNFTDIQHKCRGTQGTCLTPKHENMTADGRPTSTSCWRFAFRFHQEQCKASNGFMIQVQEVAGLGAGQEIETEMAKQVGLKIFRTTNTAESWYDQDIERVAKAIKAWDDSGRRDQNLQIIQL